MEELYFIEFFKKSPIAYSCHRAIFDNQGMPCDYEYLFINEAFENMMNIQGTNIIKKRYSDLFPENSEGENLYKKILADAVVNQTSSHIDTYRVLIQKWIRVHVFPLHENIIGCIYLDVTKTRELELQLYQSNESLIKLAEKLQEKNKVLNDLAIRDELTGIYNRHFLDQRIAEEMKVADLEQRPLSMIFFDLDHFKRVNDIWGHPIGDEVLKQTANLANSIISEPEFLVRLGGEEFAIIMPDSDLHRALAVAESIRKAMENYKFPIVGHLTASFGVAERKAAEGFCCWYQRTDKAMYRAKEAGRNRVFCSDEQDRPITSPIKFEWKRDWESGNSKIDEEHRELVEQANQLITLSLSNTENDKIIKQVDFILDKIVEHFHDEEQILLKIGYPEYENHAEIHKCLLDKVFQFKEAYQNGELKLTELFSFIVNDLIVGHILNSDSDYFPYTREKILQ